MQNLKPAAGAPHPGHARAIRVPHSTQNFAPAGFTAAQAPHALVTNESDHDIGGHERERLTLRPVGSAVQVERQAFTGSNDA
jgi:hypothetical protein